MAHAAQIENDVVINVIVVPDDLDSNESDQAIEDYCHSIGLTGTWIRTSYNGNIRGRMAGIGYKYDQELDEFVPPTTDQR